jgi:hypothetical protein
MGRVAKLTFTRQRITKIVWYFQIMIHIARWGMKLNENGVGIMSDGVLLTFKAWSLSKINVNYSIIQSKDADWSDLIFVRNSLSFQSAIPWKVFQPKLITWSSMLICLRPWQQSCTSNATGIPMFSAKHVLS